jgi:hypothetical protein
VSFARVESVIVAACELHPRIEIATIREVRRNRRDLEHRAGFGRS